MIEFSKLTIAEIKKKQATKPKESQTVLEKLHSHFYRFICLVGKSSPKKHGKYWDLQLGDYKIHMDDYNGSIYINDEWIGGSAGGIRTAINIKTYKYFVGLLYQHCLKVIKLKGIK